MPSLRPSIALLSMSEVVLEECVTGRVLIFLILIFFIQAEPYIGITPGCAASESGVTSPELLIMFPYDNLERF